MYVYRSNNNSKSYDNKNNNITALFLVLDGLNMWMNGCVNDDKLSMIVFFVIFFYSIQFTNGIDESVLSTTTIPPTAGTLFLDSLPIDKLLNQQYDSRQMTSTRTNPIRPWRKSNSIEILKKMIANRQRLANITRTSTTTTSSTTSML